MKTKTLGQILINMQKVSQEQIAQLENSHGDISLGELLIKKRIVSEDDVSYALAVQYELEICEDLSSYRKHKELYQKVPYAFVKKNLMLPLEENEDNIIVAVANPLNIQPFDELWHIFRKEIHSVFCPRTILLEEINLAYNQEEGITSQFIEDLSSNESKQSCDRKSFCSYDLLDDGEEAPVIKLINFIITEAIQQGASDIHIDPVENGMKIRYRIDGVLQNRHIPPKEYQSQLITRIKVMARLDIAEHRLPQDGRIKLQMGGREIDFRVSTVPVVHGERIVLRILDKGNVILGLENLGFDPLVLDIFRKQISFPEGIVLVTGPTGSGKTTTLYSSIFDLRNDMINIMTVEDPVEYNLPGIAQIGVQPKITLDFSRALRHVLRQDPDVIMIGEIRDKETAEIAVQAALTGHLVMSTLHTNDAPSAITRLVDMGIEPYLLSSSIIGILAQRLVRVICPYCKESYYSSEQESIGHNELFRGKGCKYCYYTGYKGRHGIYELMTANSAIKRQITISADAVELRRISIDSEMQTLHDHGISLVKKGVTTLSEVLRVTRGVI